MHVSHVEVAPLAPLLIPLGEVLVWAIALGFCLLVIYIAKAFFGLAGGLLGKLPVVGGWIDAGLSSIEHKIVSTMSGAAASVDAKLGAAFHQLARVIDWLGHEIAAHANLLNTVATLVLGQAVGGAAAGALTNLFHRSKVQEGQIAALNRATGLSNARSAHAHGDVVLPRLGRLERGWADVIEHDIAGLRSRERALEDGALHTFRWIKAHPGALASTAFAGAVAWAVGRLGMGWARCTNWNRIGRQVCGTPLGDIEAILGLLATGAVIADFRELVKLAQQVEHGVAATLQDVAKL